MMLFTAKKKTDGGWRLWVAIADVSHYVQPNTVLDAEAYTRGTSVYFPNRVIPMLPEKLSNELCSLNPYVDRLCLVAEMRIKKDGSIARSSFYPAVIHSQGRLTY
ncbi:MAG: RNB domain-containing ribonuclease, partial [Gammaproteobacteria bacterium]|nr:RNB domain-containing ribonuclease [Gammaproteobacteria bacterium]